MVDRLVARVEAVVEGGTAAAPHRGASRRRAEVTIETAVNEHIQRRVGDDKQVAKSSVVEERVRTSEELFVHGAMQHLLRHNKRPVYLT